MEDGDTKKSQPETPENLSRRSPAVVTDKKTGGAKGSNKKANRKKKKWGLLRHWRLAGWPKRLGWIGSALVVVTGIGALGVYIVQTLQSKWHFEAEHRPLVVHNRPPQILQTFKCIPAEHGYQPTGKFAHGDFQFGNIDKTYKNIGNATAYKVFPLSFEEKVIPDKPTGDRFGDDRIVVSSKACESSIYIPLGGSPLEPGSEETVSERQSTVGVPAQVKDGDFVQFEFKTCTFYSEENGAKHGTCDLYRLFTKDVSLAPIDRISGVASIPCDGVERTGKFVPLVGGHCQK